MYLLTFKVWISKFKIWTNFNFISSFESKIIFNFFFSFIPNRR